ncbi:NAC domain-containing protein 18-like isoform X1 [Zingiber officinale]|uniref:NAC domain-containing protein n=2 Tax=Zingiber officinale TaxID=94328 RepID=A0A8J5C9Q4_ZINOF|nr:NAC domain-containing protein 18-like isoform X1 [Zingiber officinale]KAG6473385.1 hypothetical protein ZIOFF_067301 [Zingiber officinale]
MRGSARANLGPLVPGSVLVGTNINSMDEEVIRFLLGRRAGDPTLENVIADVNPFNDEPWNFPENIWFLYNPGGRISPKGNCESKATRSGYWRQTGDCRIFTSGCNFSWKRTLEFYKGKSPIGERTGWVMHEYHVESNSLNVHNCSKDHSSLYRVFRQSAKCAIDCKEKYSAYADKLVREDVDYISPFRTRRERIDFEDLPHNSQIVADKDQGESAPSRRRPNELASVIFSENMLDICDFSNGEYLELNDFYSSDTHASSDDSSIMSENSDEFFDPVAFLIDIENDHGLGKQTERTKYGFDISVPVRSHQVFIEPSPPVGDLVIEENSPSSCLDRNELTSNQPLPSPSDQQQNVNASTSSKYSGKEDDQTADTSHSRRTSKGIHISNGGGSNSVRKITKIGKRYFCFASF